MSKTLCSVLIPTRNRPAMLDRCLQSVFGTCGDPDQIEALLYVDDDDETTMAHWLKLRHWGRVKAMRGPRLGFARNSQVFDALAAKALGKWVWLLNDDVVITGEAWDEKLQEIQTKRWIVGVERSHMHGSIQRNGVEQAFPIIPNGCWKQFAPLGMPEPADRGIHAMLTGRGWCWRWLQGITCWHDINEDTTRQEHAWRPS